MPFHLLQCCSHFVHPGSGGTKRRKWGGLGCVARTWINIVTKRKNVNYMRRCMWLGSVTSTWCQGLNWISDPAPFLRDPLPLITNHVPQNWDPAPFCWDLLLCLVESKHQTLFKSHKSQTECVECSKTLVGGRNPTFAIGPSGSSFAPSGFAPIDIHHLLFSYLTTAGCGCGTEHVCTCDGGGLPQCYTCNGTSRLDCQRSQVLQTCPGNDVRANICTIVVK